MNEITKVRPSEIEKPPSIQDLLETHTKRDNLLENGITTPFGHAMTLQTDLVRLYEFVSLTGATNCYHSLHLIPNNHQSFIDAHSWGRSNRKGMGSKSHIGTNLSSSIGLIASLRQIGTYSIFVAV